MRHSWILEVLRDLRSYAEANNLPAIAAAATQTLAVAETEIAAQPGPDDDGTQSGGFAG